MVACANPREMWIDSCLGERPSGGWDATAVSREQYGYPRDIYSYIYLFIEVFGCLSVCLFCVFIFCVCVYFGFFCRVKYISSYVC